MKAPVYERQVMPEAYGNSFDVNIPSDAFGVKTQAVDTSGLAKGFAGAVGLAANFAQEKENVQVWKAINDMRERGTQQLYAKDTGLLNLKGTDADGIGDRLKAWTEEQRNDIIKSYKLNSRQQDAFYKGITAVTDSWQQAAMKHEQGQFDVVRTATYNSAMETSLNAMIADPGNEELCREQRNLMDAAKVALMDLQKLPDEVQVVELQKSQSKAEMARVQALLDREDPRGAKSILEAHKGDFVGSDYEKASKAVQTAMDKIEVQEQADILARRYDDQSEAAGIAWIRKHYEGEKETRLVSEFKTRMAEKKSARLQAEANNVKAQNKRENAYYKSIEAGNFFSPEDLRTAAEKGEISYEAMYRISGRQQQWQTRTNLERMVTTEAQKNGETLTEEEKEKRVQIEGWKRSGLSYEGGRPAYRSNLLMGYITGNVPDAVLNDAYKNGLISAKDRETAKNDKLALNVQQQKFISAQVRWLADVEKNMPSNNKVKFNDLITEFNEGIKLLKVTGADTKPDYMKQIQKLAKDIVLERFANGGVEPGNSMLSSLYSQRMYDLYTDKTSQPKTKNVPVAQWGTAWINSTDVEKENVKSNKDERPPLNNIFQTPEMPKTPPTKVEKPAPKQEKKKEESKTAPAEGQGKKEPDKPKATRLDKAKTAYRKARELMEEEAN